eukprot:scaffold418_cov386-Prasinococcus_capsulatus_cf.AAC.27
MEMLRKGNRNRTQEATTANSCSSRSHAVLQVVVERKERLPNTEHSVRVGKLSLIDLAGSERASRTNNRGQRMVEGAAINRSLLALGSSHSFQHPAHLTPRERSAKGQYVPYRDSKLTRLLKDSLGGNCRTTMIANVSPSLMSLEETLNTLNYASRAKHIQLCVHRNEKSIRYTFHGAPCCAP